MTWSSAPHNYLIFIPNINFGISEKVKQPAFQICLIERRYPEARCGNKCAFVACVGSCGMSNWHVCVETIFLPLGMVTVMPFFTCCMCLIGILV